MQELKLQVSQKFYEQLAKGQKRGVLLPNGGSYKNLEAGVNLLVSGDAFFGAKELSMRVVQVYYFQTVLEALDMMGKRNLGYPSSMTSTQIEDKILSIYGTKAILANGVVVLEVSKNK